MVDVNTLLSEEEKNKSELFELDLDELGAELESVYQEIINLRKKGKDPFVVELMYRNVKSKMIYLHKSHDASQARKVKLLIKELEGEIEEVRGQKIIDVKEEIENRLRKEQERTAIMQEDSSTELSE
ncbi:hypothetical protein GOV05_01545 [Candidatus Woesearchaeota archaeon]|nr:hypothetical protein [Candidatus Woesearchaeota archaeon]